MISPLLRGRFTDQRAFGAIELLATVAIFAVLLAAGLPSIDPRRNDVNASTRQIIADFRWTRAQAMVRGQHFRLQPSDARTYDIARLEESAGSWQVAAVVRRSTLPEHIALQSSGSSVEFDSRGTLVFADAETAQPQIWTVTDSRFGTKRDLVLYPSGQIHEQQ